MSQSPATTQTGVTLLISIMILAGLTLITLAIGGFAIQQLRASRSIAITQPAIGAAETAGEQGLWLIKRKDLNDPSQLVKCDLGTTNDPLVSSNSRAASCRSYGAATFAIKANTSFSFYLYDPNFVNGNGDIDLQNYQYDSLTLNYLSGSAPLSLTMVRLNNSITGISTCALSPCMVNVGASQGISITPVPAGTEGRMKVTLLSSGDGTVQVNTSPNGMPTFPTIDATGCSSKEALDTFSSCNGTNQEIFSRRINVMVPQ